jgi:hypothetical protein
VKISAKTIFLSRLKGTFLKGSVFHRELLCWGPVHSVQLFEDAQLLVKTTVCGYAAISKACSLVARLQIGTALVEAQGALRASGEGFRASAENS